MKRIFTLVLFLVTTLIGVAQNAFDRFVPTSGTNSYTTNITGFPSSYNSTQPYIRFGNGNTGASTLAINGLSPIPIRLWDGNSWELLVSGDIPANSNGILTYDNSNGYFKAVIFENIGSGGGGSITDGSGTTANGTAVDLGGTITGSVNIVTTDANHGFTVSLAKADGSPNIRFSSQDTDPGTGWRFDLNAASITMHEIGVDADYLYLDAFTFTLGDIIHDRSSQTITIGSGLNTEMLNMNSDRMVTTIANGNAVANNEAVVTHNISGSGDTFEGDNLLGVNEDITLTANQSNADLFGRVIDVTFAGATIRRSIGLTVVSNGEFDLYVGNKAVFGAGDPRSQPFTASQTTLVEFYSDDESVLFPRIDDVATNLPDSPDGSIAYDISLDAFVFKENGAWGVFSGIQSVNSGSGIIVDNTDPDNPIVNWTGPLTEDVVINGNLLDILIDSVDTFTLSNGGDLNLTFTDQTYTSSTFEFNVNSSGTFVVNGNAANFAGVQEVEDYSANYNSLSLINRGHADGRYYKLATGGTFTGPNNLVGTSTNTLTFTFDALGVTQTDGAGHWLRNSTAAAAGAQQISPSTVWEGQGWKTNATAASQSVKFAVHVLPVQGAANPTGRWKLESSINGAAYVNIFNVLSDGTAVWTNTSSTGDGLSVNSVSSGVSIVGNNSANAARKAIQIANGTSGTAARSILDFVNNANFGLTLSYTSSSYSQSLLGTTIGANTGLIYNEQNAPLVLGTNATQRLWIEADGRIRIGGTSTTTNGLLDLQSTTQAFIPPRMTSTQRDAISSPSAGMVIYNTTTNKLNVYTTAWEAVTSL